MLALMTGRLDPNTPWVKSKVVAALVTTVLYESRSGAGDRELICAQRIPIPRRRTRSSA